MKHTLAFLLLLAAVLSLGYFGIDIPKLFKNSSDNALIICDKESVSDKSIYFSSGESGFEPMSILELTNGQNFPETDHCYRDLCTAIVASISHYDRKTTYESGVSAPINSVVFRSSNNYLYYKGYKYYNPDGEFRMLDYILTRSDFRIVYLRFYAENEPEPSFQQSNAALEKIAGEADGFFQNMQENDFLINIGQDTDEFFELFTYITSADYDVLMDKFNKINDYIAPYPSDSTSAFWTYSFSLWNLYIDVPNAFSLCPTTTFHTLNKLYCLDLVVVFPPHEYTLYKNSVFRTLSVGSYRLTTIYNINDERIEGFYAPFI